MIATADSIIKRQRAITDRFLTRSLLQSQDAMSPRYSSRFLGLSLLADSSLEPKLSRLGWA